MPCELENPCEPCSTSKPDRLDAAEFMDELWFFHNMLARRTTTSKPSPTGLCYPNSRNESAASVPREGIPPPTAPTCLPKQNHSSPSPDLLRTPSLPPPTAKGKPARQDGITHERNSWHLQRSFSSAASAPPLQPTVNLHSSAYSKVTETGSQSPAPKPIISRQRRGLQRANSSIEGEKREGKKSPRSMMGKAVNIQGPCRLRSYKSLSQLEVEEVQGFMDLGFVFDKAKINPSILSIVPGLQERKHTQDDDSSDERVARPYLSEAWLIQRPPPPPPPQLYWVDGKPAVDMKAQLKEWARSVASNVRQW